MPRDFEDNRIYALGHRLCRALFLAWTRMEVYGVEHIPREGGALLMCNHTSYLDPVFIGAGADRELCYMARSTLFVKGPVEWLLRQLNAFPVRRDYADRAALKHTLELAHSGRLVVIFPEGTRSWDGQLGQAAGGAAFLAYHAQVPVIPIYLHGVHHVLPRGASRPRRAKVRMYVGKPLDLREARARRGREVYRQIGRQIIAALADLQRQADTSRRDRSAHLVVNRSRRVRPTGRRR